MTEAELKAIDNTITEAVYTDMRQFIRLGRLSQWDLADIRAVIAPVTAPLLAHVRAVEAHNKQLREQLMAIEEREAAVCPEDVGFDEYIRTLQRQLDQIRQERDRTKGYAMP